MNLKTAIKNPLPCGIETHARLGYNYHNELKSIHPSFNWVKYVAYVIEANRLGLKATQKNYYRNKYGKKDVYRTNTGTWTSLSNAGYIYYDPQLKSYKPTEQAEALMKIVKENFGGTFGWNSMFIFG